MTRTRHPDDRQSQLHGFGIRQRFDRIETGAVAAEHGFRLFHGVANGATVRQAREHTGALGALAGESEQHTHRKLAACPGACLGRANPGW